jgi:hypothetical protein
VKSIIIHSFKIVRDRYDLFRIKKKLKKKKKKENEKENEGILILRQPDFELGTYPCLWMNQRSE